MILSEQIVLAGLCQHGHDIFLEISDFINEKVFTDSKNKSVFLCVQRCFAQSLTITELNLLAEAQQLGIQLDQSYLSELFELVVDKSNIIVHAKRIAKINIAKQLQLLTKEIYGKLSVIDGSESVHNIVSMAEKPILDFIFNLNNTEEKPIKLGEHIVDYIEHLKNNQSKSVGISSGYARYDEYIGGGFRRKTVSLLGARMKVGKSVFGDNVAIHVAHRLKIPVLMIDTEMSLYDHYNRLLAYFTKIHIKSVETAAFVNNPTANEKINKAVNIIKNIPYTYKNVAGKSFEEILSIIHRWIIKDVGFDENGNTKDCLVIYDYLKLMKSSSISSTMQEFQVLGFQISELHNFCVKYDIPVLAFVQLNREGIVKDSTDVVSQSDRLLWLCTNFAIFRAKTTEEILEDGAEFGNRKLIPLVARHGPGIEDGNYINMFMQGEYAMLEELRTKAEIVKNDDGNSFVVEDAPFE